MAALGSSNAIVAHVGSTPVTAAMLQAATAEEEGRRPARERLTPPNFSACISYLQAEAKGLGQVPPASGALIGKCQSRYQALSQQVLGRLITSYWLLGGARELGLSVGGGATPQTRGELAARAIQKAVSDSVGAVTQTRVRQFYETHRELFATFPQERDIYIARAKTEAAAIKARREIEGGRSFAQVIKGLGKRQAAFSIEGLVLELKKHVYGEPRLNNAIFAAKPGVLTGPVSTSFGYYVFKVRNIRPGHYKSLSSVEAAIRHKLPEYMRRQALAAFIRRWRAKWTASTDCHAGFVVAKCRQFAASASPPDPYSLS